MDQWVRAERRTMQGGGGVVQVRTVAGMPLVTRTHAVWWYTLAPSHTLYPAACFKGAPLSSAHYQVNLLGQYADNRAILLRIAFVLGNLTTNSMDYREQVRTGRGRR